MALSAKQKAVIEYWVNHPYDSFTEIQNQTKISKALFYKWRQDKEFMEEFHRQNQQKFEEMETLAVKKMLELADKGHWNAIKYILDNRGYAAAQKIDLDTNVIKVTIDDD